MSNDNALNSPIRWAGSKRKLLHSILQNIPPSFTRYVEPFCGSLSLYLRLPPHEAILSDINPELIHFYKMVRWRPRAVSDYLSNWDTKNDTYYEVRSLSSGTLPVEMRAARFLYLNRLCFNGVYRTNSRGEFNVPRGTKVPAMPSYDDLLNLSRRLRDAEINCTDFSATLSLAQKGDFVYLDPPYAGRGVRNRGEYGPGSFEESDIQRLRDAVSLAGQRGAKILISYADVEVIREEFKDWNLSSMLVPRNVSGFARGRGFAGELFLRNY